MTLMDALERCGTLSSGNSSIIQGRLALVNRSLSCNADLLRSTRAQRSARWREFCKRRCCIALWLASFVFAPLSIATSAIPQWAVAVFPSGAEFALEIAADAQSQQRGYMFREHVGEHEGMLFLYQETAHHGIWMKNCKVKLDIIWLDKELQVLDIAPNQAPCETGELCPTLLPARRARYVLEVAGGTTGRERLQLGNRLVILSEPALP